MKSLAFRQSLAFCRMSTYLISLISSFYQVASNIKYTLCHAVASTVLTLCIPRAHQHFLCGTNQCILSQV